MPTINGIPDHPGYRFDLENRDNAGPVSEMPMSFADNRNRPAVIDPRPWHRVENQGPMGSCRGHSGTSCLERLWWVATGGEVRQISRIFCYLATQKLDGLLGRDVGSTISNGIKLMRESGVPCESDVPYPNPVLYPDAAARKRILSPENYAKGEPFRVRSVVRITNAIQARDWIGGGGAVDIGISWPVQLDRHGICRTFNVNAGGGGHAIAFLGYDDAHEWFWVANSHGENYGTGGYFRITYGAFNQMLRHRWTSCWGVSDMAQPKPRHVSFRRDSKMFG